MKILGYVSSTYCAHLSVAIHTPVYVHAEARQDIKRLIVVHHLIPWTSELSAPICAWPTMVGLYTSAAMLVFCMGAGDLD